MTPDPILDLSRTLADKPVLNLLSLGGGVQSSTLLILSWSPDIIATYDAVIFADTGAERPETYAWLDWLDAHRPANTPAILRVGAADLYERTESTTQAGRGIPLPLYTLSKTGSQGLLPRHCTRDYKLLPIQRAVRRLLQHHVINRSARIAIGISTDEAHRAKTSQLNYITNHFPLLDLSMSRSECLAWLVAHNVPQPPRSACFFCPFQSRAEWQTLSEHQPELFASACTLDADARRLHQRNHSAWYHPRRVPLYRAVLDGPSRTDDQSQFGNECEGLCGV